MLAEDLHELVSLPHPRRTRHEAARGDLCLSGVEVVGDLVPEVRVLRHCVRRIGGSEEGDGNNVFLFEVFLIEDHVIFVEVRVVIEVDDVLHSSGQAVNAGPKSACFVSLFDVQIADPRIHRLDHLEGIVRRPVEVAVVAHDDILGREILQGPSKHFSDLPGGLVAGNDHTDALEEVWVVLPLLARLEVVLQVEERQEVDADHRA
mmetsp:Transcript_4516/g.4941  ORF Transcript_4516/g.4941 Transcript_4516/m.4941 type:complete len:205 (-) Transcript_4516:1456-2070(-)